MTTGQKMWRCRSGSTAVEFGLISLVFIAASLGIVEFGRALYFKNSMSSAIDRAARVLMVNPAATLENIETVVRTNTPLAGTALAVRIGSETIQGQAYKTIFVTYPLELLVPGLTTRSIALNVNRRVPLP